MLSRIAQIPESLELQALDIPWASSRQDPKKTAPYRGPCRGVATMPCAQAPAAYTRDGLVPSQRDRHSKDILGEGGPRACELESGSGARARTDQDSWNQDSWIIKQER